MLESRGFERRRYCISMGQCSSVFGVSYTDGGGMLGGLSVVLCRAVLLYYTRVKQ